ncbi:MULTISPECIES: hypothetical protein [unclassified Streptomyces]|uniref:zinc finger domain-containing protein n=1 Tax=unclassified Streptomyces TaxID=2593676 RepID=UPI00037C49D2|nr:MULTISPECIES: hypothetical protein [unclassified Streptomyces]MYX36753.1 hypothetical protein [Streptomyces sp. SID8377]
MNPADAAELLTLAAAFDRRTIGEADALAWGAALHAVPFDQDARDAVARHYADTDRWITPAHVIQQRTKIRAARIAEANVFDEGRPDETPAQYLARKRAMNAAIADGRIAWQTVRQAVGAAPGTLALTGGPAPAVAAFVARMPDHVAEALGPYRQRRAQREALADAGLPDPLNVPCPYAPCQARVNEPCRAGRKRARHRAAPHPSRLDLASVPNGYAR